MTYYIFLTLLFSWRRYLAAATSPVSLSLTKYFLITLPRFLSSQQIPDKIDTSIRPRADQDNILINLFVKLEIFWLGQSLLHDSYTSRSHFCHNFRIWEKKLTLGDEDSWWLNISMFVLGIFIEQCKPMVRCCAIGLNRLNKCSVYTMFENIFLLFVMCF